MHLEHACIYGVKLICGVKLFHHMHDGFAILQFCHIELCRLANNRKADFEWDHNYRGLQLMSCSPLVYWTHLKSSFSRIDACKNVVEIFKAYSNWMCLNQTLCLEAYLFVKQLLTDCAVAKLLLWCKKSWRKVSLQVRLIAKWNKALTNNMSDFESRFWELFVNQ